MWKLLKQTKWYWYLPIISLFFIHKMSIWVFEGEDAIERGWRDIIILFLIIPNSFYVLFLILFFHIL